MENGNGNSNDFDKLARSQVDYINMIEKQAKAVRKHGITLAQRMSSQRRISQTTANYIREMYRHDNQLEAALVAGPENWRKLLQFKRAEEADFRELERALMREEQICKDQRDFGESSGGVAVKPMHDDRTKDNLTNPSLPPITSHPPSHAAVIPLSIAPTKTVPENVSPYTQASYMSQPKPTASSNTEPVGDDTLRGVQVEPSTRRSQSFFGPISREATQRKFEETLDGHINDSWKSHSRDREGLEYLDDRDLFFFDPPLISGAFSGGTPAWRG